MRILIADDDPGCRLLLQTILTDSGYEVIVCEDGQGAWAVLQKPDAPRVVILDWMMPGMNGLQVCRAIREQPARDYTYVVLLTAKTQKKDLVSAFQAGADDFLTKPVDEDQLQARLHAAERILGDSAKRPKDAAPDARRTGTAAVPTGTVSTADFVRYLNENGLQDVSDGVVASGPGAAADGAALARGLVAAGKLTAFQADALLGRRFNELRIGNYEILDRLGTGGMGTVFKARHRRMKRVVALKVMTPEVAADEVFAQRFQREVETIARLNHPNIVMAYDADESEVGPFLVMEFVNGQNLATIVARDGPVRVTEAVGDILQAARGLEYAHARGIVHRDIKPENLLRDAAGVVKVADLGLARLSTQTGRDHSGSLTQAGTVVGTVQYMAPEQAVESAVDHRADVYALGCALYFLLVGRPPYRGESMVVVMLKHRDSPIPSLRDARPDVPSELDAVYHRMVAKFPEDRYQTMTEVVSALEQVRASYSSPLAPPGTEPTRPLPSAGSANPALDLATRTQVGGSRVDEDDWGTSGSNLFSFTDAGPRPWIAGLAVVVAETSGARAEFLGRCLQNLGVGSVHTTDSGRQALETAKRVGARVLLSALRMPDMSGVQLAQALRADPACSDIGLIVTADAADTDVTTAWPTGPRIALLPAPFDLERLSQSLAEVAG